MADRQVNKPATDNPSLRSEILESAIKSQVQAAAANDELERQGQRLRGSLGLSQQATGEAAAADSAVDELIVEARAGKLRKILACCLATCCSCCLPDKRAAGLHPKVSWSPRFGVSLSSTGSEPEDTETESLVKLDNLRAATTDSAEIASWKRTLAPPPGAVQNGVGVWHRQIDASLTKLHYLAEDMGQSLDEQMKLAQMLTIYLNHGLEQVIGTNEKLTKEKNNL